MNQADNDAVREAHILALQVCVAAAKRREDQSRLWELMRTEIAARSPSQVARMEADLGIA